MNLIFYFVGKNMTNMNSYLSQMLSIEEIRMEQSSNDTPMKFENVSDLKSIAKVITDREIEKDLEMTSNIQKLVGGENYDASTDTFLQNRKKELLEKQEKSKKGIFEVPEGIIAFSNVNSISIEKNDPIYTIKHNDMKQEIYENGFYEVIGKEINYNDQIYTQKYIRPYLDIDMKEYFEHDMSGYDLFNNIIKRCDGWKNIFGDYSVSAYTNNPKLAEEKNIYYNKTAEKHLSMHIVFYERKMEIEEFKYLWEKEFFDIPIGLFDKSVYDGLLSRRTLRFHLGPKKLNTNSKPINACGKILDNKPISTQFITPTGKEKNVSLSTVLDSKLWFTEKEIIEDTEERTAMNNSNMSLELFDAIVKGFDKSIEIHAEQGINCFKIITSLNACENEQITYEKIQEAKEYIYKNADLSAKAYLRFWAIDNACDRKGKCANSPGFLYKLIKEKRPEYFKESILPLIAPKTQFVSSNYTFNDYLKNYHKFTTKSQHIDALSKCIAANIEDGGYIRKSADGRNVVYQLISCGKLKKEFNKKIILPTTEKEKEKMREQKKKVQDFKEYKLVDIVQDAETDGKLMQFDGMSLTPNSSSVLWQYRPPVGTNYNKELIEEWLAFMKSRVVHDKPLMEELYSHAARFRDPTIFNEKFFVHYEEGGNSGKSFLAGCLGEMYPRLANVAATPDMITELHCTLFSHNLMVWMEEAEKGSDYSNSKLQTAIKRITTIKGSERAMYTETKATINCAISGMNSNESTIYGLIRADKATKSRMVIVEFKKTTYTPDEFKKIAIKYIKNPDFAYSLYKYLKEDLEIPKSFCVSRYDSIEKDEFIKNAQRNNRNNFEMFLDQIVQKFEDGYISDYLTKKTFKNGDCIFGSRDQMIRLYKRENEKNVLSDDRICDSLKENGWEYKKIKIGTTTKWVYKIAYDKFKAFSKNNFEDNVEVDEDDICIEEDEKEIVCE